MCHLCLIRLFCQHCLLCPSVRVDDHAKASVRGTQTIEVAKAKVRGAVTEVAPLRTFYPAEAYHQQYLEKVWSAILLGSLRFIHPIPKQDLPISMLF